MNCKVCFMEYCPKCGNKVDDSMAFCSRCGASLKPQGAGQDQTASPSTPPYDYRYRQRHEKHEEKGEKGEKYEKRSGGYAGLVIAGLIVLFIGVLSYVNATTGFLTGPIASAIVVVIIGLAIVVAGIYYSTRSRSRNPAPT